MHYFYKANTNITLILLLGGHFLGNSKVRFIITIANNLIDDSSDFK